MNDSAALAQERYQQALTIFERGRYREAIALLQAALSQTAPSSPLGGEIQIWLVTAYEAAGDQGQAIQLCRVLQNHGDLEVRKQAKRLLYIMEAPRLASKPEWLVKIPDLSCIDEQDGKFARGSSRSTKTPKPPPPAIPEPVDPTQVDTRDSPFVWIALGGAIVMLLGLIWASRT